MFFEEPGAQFAGESDDTFFALVEGDEMFLFVGVEEALEDSFGLLEPLLTEPLAVRSRPGC